MSLLSNYILRSNSNHVSSTPDSRVVSLCQLLSQDSTSRGQTEESGSLGETENHFKTAICVPPVKKTLEHIPIPKREQQAHLQEPGLVGKVRLIRTGKLTKLNQRSGAFLLPLLDFIKTTPFYSSILGNS